MHFKFEEKVMGNLIYFEENNGGALIFKNNIYGDSLYISF